MKFFRFVKKLFKFEDIHDLTKGLIGAGIAWAIGIVADAIYDIVLDIYRSR